MMRELEKLKEHFEQLKKLKIIIDYKIIKKSDSDIEVKIFPVRDVEWITVNF